ncbi:hypothetical protein LWI29_033608 [Acer saccharum]|uniref:Uncharacterized protein n=1 Tax=Acer saccharum TaxID=4024 RepID=A0AA39SL33_ACESA|nr:hypothetical protein LWI29_033608 [Acer saccharum]
MMTLVLIVQHVILEELHPTDDEQSQPYLVGVDTDLLVGPQFVPLNYESDNGEQQLDDDGNDGDSSRIIRELMSAMSNRFQDIVKKEINNEFSAMEGRLKRRLTRVEESVAELVNQCHQVGCACFACVPYSVSCRWMVIDPRTYSEENSGSQSEDELEDSSSIAKEKSGERGKGIRVGGRKGSNGTTNINTHIRKRCKKYRPPVTDSRQTILVKQPNVEGAGSTLGTSRFSAEECRRALAEMLILDELPFRFLENRGFRKFCFAMNPRFDVPSRRTIVRDLYKLYVEERMKLKKYFKSSQKRILSFSQITDHTRESIGRCIEKVLLEWGIDKIFTITVDNATANEVAIVSDGLKDLHKSVVTIRNAVKYVKSSPSRLDRFKRAVEHEKLGNHGFVVLDVPTRWNSTYLMLESAMKLRKAFERMEEEDGHYVLYFNDKEGDEKRISPPLLDDWENANTPSNNLFSTIVKQLCLFFRDLLRKEKKEEEEEMTFTSVVLGVKLSSQGCNKACKELMKKFGGT